MLLMYFRRLRQYLRQYRREIFQSLSVIIHKIKKIYVITPLKKNWNPLPIRFNKAEMPTKLRSNVDNSANNSSISSAGDGVIPVAETFRTRHCPFQSSVLFPSGEMITCFTIFYEYK